MKATLHVRRLELKVKLGWLSQEREHEQTIELDLDIHYPALPKACETDELSDTVCYAQLTDVIRQHIAKKEYRLVEHLGAEIYALTKPLLPQNAKLIVHLVKYPQIEGLIGGVCFDYGDER